MQEYRPGERLRITLETTVYHVADGVLHVAHDNDQAYSRCLPIPIDQPGATITRLAPAGGVQAGDLWRDADGDLWFATLVDSDLDGDGTPLLMATVKTSKRAAYGYDIPEEVHRRHVLVELVHREPVDDDAAEIRRRLREAGGDSPEIGALLRRAAARTAEDERWPVDEPEPVPIAGVAPGTIVQTPKWNAGEPVRVFSVLDAGEHHDEVSVRYQDIGGHCAADTALAPADFRVTIVEEPQS
ncbi:hypothetical protein Skr01_36670 [Sphaerisporangium krabiense]|uniref:Uncharacterized protein n=1 Tax=Sphaerisporangium krabiense TaxID=763782 RepID=A0A7W9DPN1_9ACTN|nr:hypothetical protein [Sphaerisporangium krabiense]MBB5626662.1 hypothetical protein [Sphaerisporangium krabiense]GII63582.1 hypothetical protein Skr01_36670 [Sphaerisporangium krabiense]